MKAYKEAYESLQQTLIERIRQLSVPLEPQPTHLSERVIPLPKIKVVLFDIYGTLFISGTGDISIAREMSNQQALADALEFAGFSGKLEDAGQKGSARLLQAIRQTHAERRKRGIECPEVDIREEWEKVLTSLKQENLIQGELSPDSVLRVCVEYEYRVNPVWPMPDAGSVLKALREKNILLGIVSNAQFYTLLLFPAFLGKPHSELGFEPDACVWSYELSEAKPSINLFQRLVMQLQLQYGIVPEKILYVGNDMLNDIWTAAQLGLKTALFAGDQRSLRLREHDPRCSTLEPDLIITKLSQLL